MPVAALIVLDDILRLFVLIAIGGGLLLLGRWSSGLGGTPSSDFTTAGPTPDVNDLLPSAKSIDKVCPPSAEDVATSLPYDPALGKLQIKKLYFNKTDVTPGPIDPEMFADELNIQL